MSSRYWLLGALLATLTACASPKPEEQTTGASLTPGMLLAGTVTALSAQVLSIDGHRLALAGIMTPPPGQHCVRPGGKQYDCGQIARTALMDLTAGAEVLCRIATGFDRSGVPFAHCNVQGYDLSEGMVYTGWAIAWPRALQPLRKLETGARKDHRGMWNGRFEPSWLPALEGA